MLLNILYTQDLPRPPAKNDPVPNVNGAAVECLCFKELVFTLLR